MHMNMLVRKRYSVKRPIAHVMMVCSCLLVGSGSQATATNPPTITLEKTVYFTAPSGDPVTVEAGTYTMDATEQGLRLTPKDGTPESAKSVQAHAVPHLETPDAPKAIVESLGEDRLRIALFLAEGTGFEAVGSSSGIQSRAICSTCTAYGTSALTSNTTGAANTALGFQPLARNLTGNDNTAVGASALFNNVIGMRNTAVGANALNANTGGDNTAVGAFSLTTNTTGRGNTATGVSALAANTTGGSNTAVGSHALNKNSTGYYNTAVGSAALTSNTASYNTAVGAEALLVNTNGQTNTAVGHSALRQNNGSQNTAVGEMALLGNTTGTHNTAVGYRTMTSSYSGSRNTAVGSMSLSTTVETSPPFTGFQNTAIGYASLQNNSGGGDNTAIGVMALQSFNTSGGGNTAMGVGSLKSLLSGHQNTAIGYTAGQLLTQGRNNVYINSQGISSEDNTVRIGMRPDPVFPGANPSRTFIHGIAGTAVNGVAVMVTPDGQLGIKTSSLRYKDDIQNIGEVSQNLYKLRPVSFHYKPEAVASSGASQREYGLIAEEVAEVYPELVGRNSEGEIVTVKYHELIPMLLNELQRQQRQLQNIHTLRKQIEVLTTQVMELKAK